MAACLPVLWVAQEQFGWISRDVMELVAETLDLPLSHVYGVVTFYTMFNQQPRGTFHVQVCTNVACMLLDAYDVLRRFEQELGVRCGETTPDKLFTLNEVECLAACGSGPCVQINDEYREPVRPEEVAELVAQLRRAAAQRPRTDRWRVRFRPRPRPPGDQRTPKPRGPDNPMVKIVTQSFGNEQAKDIATYEQLGGYKALRKAVTMSRQQIVDEVSASNLTGSRRGWLSCGQEVVLHPQGRRHGVPGGQRRRRRARHLQGSLADVLGPPSADRRRLHRCLRHRRPLLLHLHPGRAAARDAGAGACCRSRRTSAATWGSRWPGLAGPCTAWCIVARAPISAVRRARYSTRLEGRRGYPRLKPPYPAIKGLFGKPTVVNNVETLMHVPTIVDKGGTWFADIGVPGDGGTRALAISGHVKKPGVYEVPVGTSLEEHHLRGCRWHAGSGQAAQGGDPGRQLDADAHARRDRCALRISCDDHLQADPRGRAGPGGAISVGRWHAALDARLWRYRGDRARHLHGGAMRADHALLRPRVVRTMHPVPRGQWLAGAGLHAVWRVARAGRAMWT